MSRFSKIIFILVFPVILYTFYFSPINNAFGAISAPLPEDPGGDVIPIPRPPKAAVEAGNAVGVGTVNKTCTDSPASTTSPGVQTAIGCIPTDPIGFIKAFSQLATGAGGGIALLLMIAGIFRMMTSAGNPDGVKAGSEQFTSALIGLLFIIFAVLLLRVIGISILNIPGFGPV